jgi:hypothetical protein
VASGGGCASAAILTEPRLSVNATDPSQCVVPEIRCRCVGFRVAALRAYDSESGYRAKMSGGRHCCAGRSQGVRDLPLRARLNLVGLEFLCQSERNAGACPGTEARFAKLPKWATSWAERSLPVLIARRSEGVADRDLR